MYTLNFSNLFREDVKSAMGFRFVMVKNYMIFYIVEEKHINIIRFLYGHRDWINILENTNIV